MKLGMMGVAAAALLAGAPANAATITLLPYTSDMVVTSGATTTCKVFDQSAPCTTAPPTFNAFLGGVKIDIPDFNGRYEFGPLTINPNIYRSSYTVTGFVEFAYGSLIADTLNFTYRTSEPYLGGETFTSVQAAGYYKTFSVTLPDGRVLAPVPEPATWALMLAGFGLMGFALRRRGQAAMLAGKLYSN